MRTDEAAVIPVQLALVKAQRSAAQPGGRSKLRVTQRSVAAPADIYNHPPTPKGETVFKSMSQPANDPVETFRQARYFDANKRHYQGLGLCGACAAQAAWGHQLGFSRIEPPCPECQPLVATFPVDKPGKWRSNSPRRAAKFSRPGGPSVGQ